MNLTNVKSMVCCFLVFIFYGCVYEKEVDDDCTFAVPISFHYTYNVENQDLFIPEIDNIQLYIYRNNVLFQEIQLDQSDLIDRYKYILNLPNGEFTIVVWGGIKHTYTLSGTAQIDQAILGVERDENNYTTEFPNHHFYASHTLRVDNPFIPTQRIDLVKNTNLVSVVVRDKTASRITDNKSFTCKILGVNGDYDFHNKVIGSDNICYKGYQYNPESLITFSFITMRLWQFDHSKLELTYESAGKSISLYQGSLSEIILKNPYINIDLEDEFIIEFILKDNHQYVSAEIIVNDWIVVVIDTEL